jgi:hypothetical protein
MLCAQAARCACDGACVQAQENLAQGAALKQEREMRSQGLQRAREQQLASNQQRAAQVAEERAAAAAAAERLAQERRAAAEEQRTLRAESARAALEQQVINGPLACYLWA